MAKHGVPYAVICIVLAGLMVAPATLSAQTERVEELRRQIAELRARIAALTSSAPASFDRNLSLGDRGPDVRRLQETLNKLPDIRVAAAGAGSPGRETSYFGAKTRRAVVLFQERFAGEVLEPAGLVRATGFVGPLTRAKLNDLVGVGAAQRSETSADAYSGPPEISSLSPRRGPNGTEVEISGRGFDGEENTIEVNLVRPDNYPVVASPDGRALHVELDTYIGRELSERSSNLSPAGRERVREAFPETLRVQVRVRNENGVSEPVVFTMESF